MQKIKIQAEGKNCQAAYTINNYSASLSSIKKLCDWMMIGSGIILLLTIILFSIVAGDYWATIMCMIFFGFGMLLFSFAFLLFLYFEYGVKKND